jgi:hypothetical protein
MRKKRDNIFNVLRLYVWVGWGLSATVAPPYVLSLECCFMIVKFLFWDLFLSDFR